MKEYAPSKSDMVAVMVWPMMLTGAATCILAYSLITLEKRDHAETLQRLDAIQAQIAAANKERADQITLMLRVRGEKEPVLTWEEAVGRKDGRL